jgi:hypothetical protein
MIASIRGVSKVYSILLRLFPRDFQKEFRKEMVDVFAVNLEEAAKTSTTLVVRACFFELIDLPVNLLVEHLSALRNGNFMKSLSYEVGRSRAVLMGALGMSVGWVLSNMLDNYYYSLGLRGEPFTLVGMISYTFPVILCGLMLGIAAGVGRRTYLRIVLWTAAGGILGHLASLPIRMFNQRILNTITASKYDSTFMLGLVVVMCAYGLFYGAGLGMAFGSWKAGIKLALIGLVANAVGILVGYSFTSDVVSKWYMVTAAPLSNTWSSVRVFLGYNPSYFTWIIMGALVGGILGWFVGNKKHPAADPLIRTGNAS